VQLLTTERQRRGWTLLRLSVEAGVPYFTAKRLTKGRIGLTTALKLAAALDCAFLVPTVLSAEEAQHGRPAH
jgi:hypothetical protein